LAKKQKKATSERAPTKHQLSKWQRQMKIRRIVIIAAVVFLVGISSWVGYGYYKDYEARVGPLREVVLEVNGVPFTMEYFVEYFGRVLDVNTVGMNSTWVHYYASYIGDYIDDDIINAELLRQGAKNLSIEVTTEEIDAGLKERGWPNDRVYRDIVSTVLSQEKLNEYFGSQLPNTMEQAHVQAMLVESQEVATELIAEIKAGGNFTALAEEFSCNSSIKGDLGWLPEELMPNTLIANAAFNLTPGNISQPIYDKTATKNVGYWLIEVTDKQDEAINASAMLLGSEAEAEWVKAQLAAGGNFSALAGNYSQHASKIKGGKLDGLKPGAMNSTAFDKVAFNITANQVSEPVKDESVHTTGGYWLVKVIDRGDHELEEGAKEKLIENHLNDWFEEWKGNSTIENRLDASKISWAVNKVLEGR
jgi:parvulin-like peptidyl-prolyl isomerase